MSPTHEEIEALWAGITPEPITVDQKIVWADMSHPISYRHIRDMIEHPNNEPIRVEQLMSGHYFVHDGRHRVMRAFLDGKETINAKVLRHARPL